MEESINAPQSPSKVPQVRVIFMGTPELSVSILQSLLENNYHVVAAVTKPDAKSGRKGELAASPVKQLALAAGVPVLTPEKLTPDFYDELKLLKPDLIVVAAYGKILPKNILDLPGLGCLNIHYSLLPRFRGASPIQNALLFGDTVTGVTLIKMDAGLDTGDIINTQSVTIDPHDTATTLTPKLNLAAIELTLTTLPLWIEQEITSTPQPETGVVLCQLIERADGKIEWSLDAQTIYNKYRAFDPWPGIFTYWKKADAFVRIKLLSVSLYTHPIEQNYLLGEVFQLADCIAVQTGTELLILHTVQPEGKSSMAISEFIRGNPDFIGGVLV